MDFIVAKNLGVPINKIGACLENCEKLFEANQAFKGLRVFTLYRTSYGYYREFQIDGISPISAQNTMIPINEGVNVTLYYKLKHRITLRNPQNNCVYYKKGGHYEFYPLELVRLVPHPSYKGHNLTSSSQLLRRHFQTPEIYQNYLETMAHNPPKILKHFIFTMPTRQIAHKHRHGL